MGGSAGLLSRCDFFLAEKLGGIDGKGAGWRCPPSLRHAISSGNSRRGRKAARTTARTGLLQTRLPMSALSVAPSEIPRWLNREEPGRPSWLPLFSGSILQSRPGKEASAEIGRVEHHDFRRPGKACIRLEVTDALHRGIVGFRLAILDAHKHEFAVLEVLHNFFRGGRGKSLYQLSFLEFRRKSAGDGTVGGHR